MKHFAFTLLTFALGVGSFVSTVLLSAIVIRPLREAIPYSAQATAIIMVTCAFLGSVLALKLIQTPNKDTYKVTLTLGIIFAALVMQGGNSSSLAGDPLAVGWQAAVLIMLTCGAIALWRVRRSWGIASALALVAILGFFSFLHGPDSFLARNVRFPSKDITLDATITLPTSCKPCPAVVLVPGSGQQDRDEAMGKNRPFRQLAEYLSTRGWLVLRYNKRGVEPSGGRFDQAGMLDFAADAESAYLFVQGLPETDTANIFMVGHSYGGKEATIAVSHQPQVAGLVLLASVASSEPDNLQRQQETILQLTNASAVARQNQLVAFEAWINGVRQEQYVQYEDYFKGKGLDEPYLSAQRANPMPPVWLKQAMEFDMPKTVASLRVPVLALSGESDWIVPPSETQIIEQALQAGQHPDFKVQVLPGIDHRFSSVASAANSLEMTVKPEQYYLKNAYPIPDSVLEAIQTWLRAHLKGSNSSNGD